MTNQPNDPMEQEDFGDVCDSVKNPKEEVEQSEEVRVIATFN